MPQDTLIGQNLARYEIQKRLGVGRMGTVYRARDTLLDRLVAIKLLNLDPTISKDQIERFFLEARTTSSLNHPNICTLYDFIRDDGRYFIVMELLEGESLRELLTREGTLPLHRAIEILLPVCSALQAAHDKGIIHRDIKPANIIITNKGVVKVLDFGMAKLRSELAESPVPNQKKPLEPIPLRMSSSGLSGTAHYMSPEQIRGEPVDGRSDIFSMGSVLQELLTGKPPFIGEDVWEVMQNILSSEPEPVTLASTRQTRRISPILKCALHKESVRRFQTCLELADSLKPVIGTKRVRRTSWMGALAGFLLLLFIIITSLQQTPQKTAPVLKFSPLGYKSRQSSKPSFSADGRRLAFANWNQAIDNSQTISLMDWSSRELIESYWSYAGFADLSPDGNRLVATKSGLVLIDLKSRSEILMPISGLDAEWSPDGRFFAYADYNSTETMERSAIYLYDTIGHANKRLSPVDAQAYAYPNWSGDGKTIVCTLGLGSIRELGIIDVRSGDCFQLSDFNTWCWYPAFSPDGKWIYYVSSERGSSDLFRIKYNRRTKKIVGSSEQLSSGVGFGAFAIHPDGGEIVFDKQMPQSHISSAYCANPKTVDFSARQTLFYLPYSVSNMEISPDGQFILLECEQAGFRSLLVYDVRNGKEVWRFSDKSPYTPCWFPDGQWIVFDAGGGDQADIWRINLRDNRLEKIVEHPGADWGPTVSPDCKWLCFTSNRSGDMQLWLQDLETGAAKRLTFSQRARSRGFWSHDNSRIAFWEVRENDSLFVCLYDLLFEKQEAIFIRKERGGLFYKQLVWGGEDSTLFFRYGDTILTQLSLKNKSMTNFSGKNWEQEPLSCFALHGHQCYTAHSTFDTELWLAEVEE